MAAAKPKPAPPERAKPLPRADVYPARVAAVTKWIAGGGSADVVRLVFRLQVFHAADLTTAQWTSLLKRAAKGEFARTAVFDPRADVVRVKR